MALPSPPSADEVRAVFDAHPERYESAGAPGEPVPFSAVEAQVRDDLIAEREEARYEALISRLKERYPVVYDEAALLRIPL